MRRWMAREIPATKSIITGRKRPAPQAGPHFCTSTSKRAKHTAAPPASSMVNPTRPDRIRSVRFNKATASVLITAASQSRQPSGSPIKIATLAATRMTFTPRIGVATETSPRAKERKASHCPPTNRRATTAGCQSCCHPGKVPPIGHRQRKPTTVARFDASVVVQAPIPNSLPRFAERAALANKRAQTKKSQRSKVTTYFAISLSSFSARTLTLL